MHAEQIARREGRSLGSYALVKKLGTGGMAEVYLAAQHMAAGDVTRPVVIKAILPHLGEDEHFVEMFMREAKVAAMLQHPNVVHIHDVAVLEERPCIVMEFLRGRDLWTVLQRVSAKGEGIDPVAAAIVAAQASTGLDYAHRKRDRQSRPLDLVHRDISPHNIFICRDGQVKIVDFGVAKSAFQEQRTQSGVIKGKLAYMAPEQARGKDVDHRADQFALGIVMWEMVTGTRLFAREDAFQTMTAMFHEDTPKPSSVREVPLGLEEIIMKALETNPTHRYQSCEELAHVLRAWVQLQDSPPEARTLRTLLNEAVPVLEDEAFYEPDLTLSGSSQSFLAKEPTPSENLVESVVDTTSEYKREKKNYRKFALLGLIPLIGLMIWLFAGGEEAPEPVRPLQVRTLAGSQPVLISFENVPSWATLEVDGAQLEERQVRIAPSDKVHAVCVMFEGKELWRYDGIFKSERTVQVPSLEHLHNEPKTTAVATPTVTMNQVRRAGSTMMRRTSVSVQMTSPKLIKMIRVRKKPPKMVVGDEIDLGYP